MEKGYSLVSGGTDNHLILWDLRPQGITRDNNGEIESNAPHSELRYHRKQDREDLRHGWDHTEQKLRPWVRAFSNHSDRSAMTPGGVRIGAPAMTTRGTVEADWAQIADFLHEAVQITIDIQKETGPQLAKFLPVATESKRVQELHEVNY